MAHSESVWNAGLCSIALTLSCPGHSQGPECGGGAHRQPPRRSESAQKAGRPEGGGSAQNCPEVRAGSAGSVEQKDDFLFRF